MTLMRGQCLGRCGSYELSIRGNGTVDYEGWAFVKTHGRQTRTLTKAQLHDISSSLDEAAFLSIEDRAFRWCLDTPSVAVSFTSGNRTKTVSSDAFCVGSKTGAQARFIKALQQIDQIVGTDDWVRCKGLCR